MHRSVVLDRPSTPKSCNASLRGSENCVTRVRERMSTYPATNPTTTRSARPGTPANGQARVDQGLTRWRPPEDMDQRRWMLAGRQFGVVGRSSNWWIGDWLRYGAAKWGAKYTAAAKITGYDVHSLENMVYVASRFPFSLRRENLSWSHHFLLAALVAEEQLRWLDYASMHHLSVNDLRLELRASRRSDSAPFGAGATARETPKMKRLSVCPQCGYHL
jgi:hypothetical protein